MFPRKMWENLWRNRLDWLKIEINKWLDCERGQWGSCSSSAPGKPTETRAVTTVVSDQWEPGTDSECKKKRQKKFISRYERKTETRSIRSAGEEVKNKNIIFFLKPTGATRTAKLDAPQRQRERERERKCGNVVNYCKRNPVQSTGTRHVRRPFFEYSSYRSLFSFSFSFFFGLYCLKLGSQSMALRFTGFYLFSLKENWWECTPSRFQTVRHIEMNESFHWLFSIWSKWLWKYGNGNFSWITMIPYSARLFGQSYFRDSFCLLSQILIVNVNSIDCFVNSMLACSHFLQRIDQG